MPYFKNNDINILFIHIPKTGGSSLEQYFSSKFNIQLNEESLFTHSNKNKKINNNMQINSSLQHLTYTQIIKYNDVFNIDFNNIKIITIVRNPYERIISDLFWFKKIYTHTSTEHVVKIIKKYLTSNNVDNHNIQQYMFITNSDKTLISNIHILRTETLTDDMIELGYKDFNVCVNNNKQKVNYYDYLNDEAIAIINDFYHYDFVLFNYIKKLNF